MGKFAVLIEIVKEADKETIRSAIEDAIKTNMPQKDQKNIEAVKIIKIMETSV